LPDVVTLAAAYDESFSKKSTASHDAYLQALLFHFKRKKQSKYTTITATDYALLNSTLNNLQGVPIKNNPLEKMLYFSHGSMDLSQTFRLCMQVFTQHNLQIL